MIFFKKKAVPETNNTKEIVVFDSYRVNWVSARKLSSLADLQDESEFFLTKEQAEEFAESLRNARKILKDRGFSIITVEKN